MRWKMERTEWELILTRAYEFSLKEAFRSYEKACKRLTTEYENAILDSRHEARTDRGSFVGLPRG